VAVRSEELAPDSATVYQFPTQAVRTRVARQRALKVRRRLAALCGSVLFMGLFLAGGAGPGRAVASRADAPRAVVLGPGDTLWGVAERFAPPSVDPRAYVDVLIELNDLSGAPVAGARLKLP